MEDMKPKRISRLHNDECSRARTLYELPVLKEQGLHPKGCQHVNSVVEDRPNCLAGARSKGVAACRFAAAATRLAAVCAIRHPVPARLAVAHECEARAS